MNPFFGYGLLLAVLAGVTAQVLDAPKPPPPGTSPGTAVVYGAQAPAPAACVKLVRSEPFLPDESPMPKYPEAAQAARVEGDVSFHLEVGSACAAEEIKIDEGPEMLREAVANAVKDWKYCGVPEGQEIRATVAFRLNCSAK